MEIASNIYPNAESLSTELCCSPRERTSGSALIKSTPLSSIGLPRFVSGFSTNGPPEEESDQSTCKRSPCEEDSFGAITSLSNVHGENQVPEASSSMNSKKSPTRFYCQKCPFIACQFHVVGFHGGNSGRELLSHIETRHPNKIEKLLKCDIEQCGFSNIGFHSFSGSVEHSYNHDRDKNYIFMESEHDGARLDTYLDITTPADFWKTDKNSVHMRFKQITSPKWGDDDRTCERCSHESPSPVPEDRQPKLLQDFYQSGRSIEGEEKYDDSDTDLEIGSNFEMGVLESDMVSIFGQDLGLVARMIPDVHARMLLSRVEENTSYAGSDYSTSPGISQGSQGRSSVSINSNPPPSLSRLKRPRDPDHPDDNDQNDGFKKPRPKIIQNRNRGPCFACPFYKRNPQKYRASTETGLKYRTCIGPGNPELRRLKDHLKNTHKLSQCDKCYKIFDAPIHLIAHRKLAQCQLQPDELKEGIDDDQWPKIEELFKVKRGKIVIEDKSDTEKWFDMWRILYPGIPLPEHPWYDSVQTDSPPVSRAMEVFLSNMDKITRFKLEQKGLPFNQEYHDLYLLGAYQAYGTEAAIKKYIENSNASQFEEFPSSDASSCWGTSSNLSPSIHCSNMQPAASDGNFEVIPLSINCRTTVLPGERATQNQISRQPVFEDSDLDKWDHSDLGSLGDRQVTYQDKEISGFASGTSTLLPWESWPHGNSSEVTFPTTDASQFSLEDFINLDPPLSYGEDFQCGDMQVHDEQYNTGGNNQLHSLSFLDDEVERISLGGREESCFQTNGQTGENPLSELLRSELEAETYPKPGPLESKSYKNRGLHSPAK